MITIASMGPRHLSRGIKEREQEERDGRGASMGPRHLSRGIYRTACRSLATPPRFNGATASEPWNRWPGPVVTGAPRRFNGATASEPWNPESRREQDAGEDQASMGPRHLSRGIKSATFPA